MHALVIAHAIEPCENHGEVLARREEPEQCLERLEPDAAVRIVEE